MCVKIASLLAPDSEMADGVKLIFALNSKKCWTTTVKTKLFGLDTVKFRLVLLLAAAFLTSV